MARYYYVQDIAAYGGATDISIDGQTYLLFDQSPLYLSAGDSVRIAGDDALSPRTSTARFALDDASYDAAPVDIFAERTTTSYEIDFTDRFAGQLKPTVTIEDGTNAPGMFVDLRSAEDATLHVGSPTGTGATIGNIDGGILSYYDDKIFVHQNSSTGNIMTHGGDDQVVLGDNVTVNGYVQMWYGNDTLQSGNGVTFNGDVSGYYGNDTITLGDNNVMATDDEIEGGGDNDVIRVGENYFSNSGTTDINGGSGDDTIILRSWNYNGYGDEVIDGGSGTDMIKFHVPDAGTGTDADFYNWITGQGYVAFPLAPHQQAFYQNWPGTVDAGSNGYGTAFDPDLQFRGAEYIVICFAGDTLITTPCGSRRADQLRVGDTVLTRDHGPQDIRWIGQRRLDAQTLRDTPHLRPIRFAAGALGPGVPAQDLTVSRQHRMVVRSQIVNRMCGVPEALVPACKLLDLPGVKETLPKDGVTYVHMLFDRHEIVWANGAEAESLLTGPEALRAMGPRARREILTLFPDLRRPRPASPLLRGRRAVQLARRHRKNAKALQAG